MSYATQADMTRQFGERELIMLTDRAMLGVVDGVVVADALARASSLIEGYLGDRFGKPLPSVPVEILDACCDIARYKLCGTDARSTDDIRIRYKDALKLLAQIRDGELNVGLSAQGVALASTLNVLSSSAPRVMTAQGLAGFV